MKRGEDGSFGLGLSEDNEIIHFYHQENAGVLRLGDQIRAVDTAPLVRERLAVLLQREFSDRQEVPLHLSRAVGPAGQHRGDVFAALQLRNARGEDLGEEWLSELWELKTDSATWGTFWTMPLLPGTSSAYLGVHISHMFTEPLLGYVELDLNSQPAETLTTRWHSLLPEDTDSSDSDELNMPRLEREIEGEVLLTVRKFYSLSSVSYGPDGSDDEDDEPTGPIDHHTAPMPPIPEPLFERAYDPPRLNERTL